MSTAPFGEDRAGNAALSSGLRRWSVVAVGAFLAIVSIAGGLVDGPVSSDGRVAIPLLASVAIIGAGVLIQRTELGAGDISAVAVWIVTTAVMFGGVVMSAAVVMSNDPIPVGSTILTFMAPIGALGGSVAGYYDARRRKQHRVTKRTERALETATDGIAILNDADEYVTVNQSHADIYGYDDPAAMVGETWDICYSDEETTRLESDALPMLDERNEWRGEATGRRADGSTFPQELTLTRMEDGGIVCIVRDITDQRERERQYRQQKRRLQTIVENVPIVLFAFEPDGTLTLSEGKSLEALGLEPGEVVGDSMFDIYADAPEVIEACELALSGETVHRTTKLGPVALEAWMTPVTDDDGTVTQVIGTGMDVTEQHEWTEQLTELHDASRQLTYTNSIESVAETTVTIAESVLDSPVSTLWRYDDETDSLHPVAMTDSTSDVIGVEAVEDLSPVRSDRLGMEVFRSGESRSIADYQTIENRAFDWPLSSVLIVPLGEYGILQVGKRDADEIDSQSRQLIEILGLNAQAALDRAEREQLLRERTEELEMRTSQMEFINSILRHDILNGMTVIRARAEFLEADLDDQAGEYAETIVRWCDDISGFIERVQTVLNALSDEDAIALKPVEATALFEAEFEQLRQTYPDVTFDTSMPDEAWVQADELLADLLSNIARNAIEHNDREDLRVTVRIEPGMESTTIRVADNGRGIPADRHEVAFRRGESHAKSTGSGFGLFFVDVMVDAYGGDIRIEDNEPGAAFVIELPTSSDEPVESPKRETR
ncbi:PAS domain S-box protein [Natrinema sp. DC36]|uniref:PAS domain S-box protein n=1 Tax=Natrinema sp. DC36 TaxID=2878680 RepID=UPI001CF0BBE4|nr:PAS domain S-box protein [Natrinema sp. DC36]